MGAETRRQRDRQDRHDAILDAAEAVFFSKGYERCTMHDIARASQVSRPLLYVYFTDKLAIMHGITLRAAQTLQARFAEALQSSAVGAEQVEAIGHAYYRFSVEQPDYFDALSDASSGSYQADAKAEVDTELSACVGVTMQLMVSALQRGVADGSLSAVRVSDPMTTAYFLRGAVHGVIMQCRSLSDVKSGHPAPDALVSYTLEMLSRAMAP